MHDEIQDRYRYTPEGFGMLREQLGQYIQIKIKKMRLL